MNENEKKKVMLSIILLAIGGLILAGGLTKMMVKEEPAEPLSGEWIDQVLKHSRQARSPYDSNIVNVVIGGVIIIGGFIILAKTKDEKFLPEI